MEQYAVINQDGLVINVVMWDGVTQWPVDHDVIKLPTGSLVGGGFTYDPDLDEFVAPVVEEPIIP
tara:strand:+ start:244 stop:438 length:195 start_codon:yes stop_codon:yes gene_type:complete